MLARLFPLVAAGLATALPLAAQNCAATSVGLTPLSDLGVQEYQGFDGGLYGGGANTPPATHAAAGAVAAAAVQPRDAAGIPDPAGRIVVASIGMSNATQEFSSWVALSNADPLRNPAVTVVDAAKGGEDARKIANPQASYWAFVDQRLAQAGVTPAQLQVVWIKEAIAGPNAPFPASAQELQSLLATIAQILKSRYPNLSVCYLSSRIYAGYATTALNPEPFAYESGFAVRWVIEQQIGGDPALNHDPAAGPVQAPWLAWGPYLWADGLTPRSDGLQWLCSDFQPDGTHPSTAGRDKVAQLLDAHFTTDPFAVPWYGGGGGGEIRAAVVPYGTGCPGAAGALSVRAPTTPFLGNPQFNYGIANAVPGTAVTLFWALGTAQIPLQGCTFWIDPALVALAQPLTANTGGRAQMTVAIPADPTLEGVSLYTQWLALDPGAPGLQLIGGAAMTRGIELRLGQP